MSDPVVYGESYSVYVRAVRLALEEKAVAYRLEPIDIFADDGVPQCYAARQPFGKIPAFEHQGFQLYEAVAINQFIDEAFPGEALSPSDPRERARMRQVISVLDSYGYRTFVWDIYVQRVRLPQEGGESDETVIASGVEKGRLCLAALGDLIGDDDFLLGARPGLADCHAYPMLRYLQLAPEGAALLEESAWATRFLSAMALRQSVQATRSPLEPQNEPSID